jgi:probable F420-dependent oxidoreductase
MRFGVQFTHAGNKAEWTRMAQWAEQEGFDVISLPDHIGDKIQLFAPLIALAAAAAVTSTIRLTATVLNNDLRHPAILAKELATLDIISDGRVDVGLGAGWAEEEYRQAGIKWDLPSQRIARLAETIQIMKELLGGKTSNYQGQAYRISNLKSFPQPLQGRMPFFIGGGGKKILSLAAREADIVGIVTNNGVRRHGVYPDMRVERLYEQMDWIRTAAGERIKDIELNIRILYGGVGDRQAIAERIGAQRGMSAEDTIRSPHGLVGSLEQVEKHILWLRDTFGITYLTMNYDLAKQVAPLIKMLGGRKQG